ncbi:GapR family DNA-binding domain-containing protein [Labrenzia sp. OB1]|uniref:GapR family DNA-binding domain-containing protein n=1 Tax=Labrenzia sp. OB1 TaxID=1561204 RepID=UPI0007B2856C|nr:GapR family DNA-binding domain-containing protein [Labrenzia sp. OB1]KZM48267.1 hypothetical protein OA90_21145 [Labrenzia sp. OB1]
MTNPGGVAADQLRAFIERIERLEEDHRERLAAKDRVQGPEPSCQVAEFWAECTEEILDATTSFQDLFEEYRNWSWERGQRCQQVFTFGCRIEGKAQKTRLGCRLQLLGIRLRNASPQSAS